MHDSQKVTSDSSDEATSQRSLEHAVLFVIVGTLFVTAGIVYIFAVNQIGHWQIWQRPGSISGQQWFEHIRNAATLVGVPVVGSALVFSYFRQKSTDRSIGLTERQVALTSHQLDLARKQVEQAITKDERDHLSKLRERFSAASDSLAEDDEMNRSTGISMMIAVANDFQALKDEAGRQDCIDALVRLLTKLDGQPGGWMPARRLWKKIGTRMAPLNSAATNWWDADVDLRDVQTSLGPMVDWVLTGGRKEVSATAISSGSTSVVQNINLDGGNLSIHLEADKLPLRLIQNEFQAGTLTIGFATLVEGPPVSFEDSVFQNVRLVITDRMAPSPKRILRFFRCTFMSSSFDLPDDLSGYFLEFSQCTFHDIPRLAPLPESRQPVLDLWDRNTFEAKAAGYLENPEEATDFDRWSRKSSPYVRRLDQGTPRD